MGKTVFLEGALLIRSLLDTNGRTLGTRPLSALNQLCSLGGFSGAPLHPSHMGKGSTELRMLHAAIAESMFQGNSYVGFQHKKCKKSNV